MTTDKGENFSIITQESYFITFSEKMNFDDGFTLVKPGKKSRRNVNTKIHNVLQDIDIDETIERIQKAKEELHQSEFMQKFLSSSDILEEIKFIYCFGLGQLRSVINKIIPNDFFITAYILVLQLQDTRRLLF